MVRMQTDILDTQSDLDKSIHTAVDWLRSGIPVSFATETVYGLGAGIFDLNGVSRVFNIKGRDFRNPLSAHISSIKDAEMLCQDIKDDFYKLAEAFLPGPLSIVMKKKMEVPSLVTGGGETLSIRFPDNDIFIGLSKAFGQPIAATSANKSGKPSPISANDVFDDLNGLIPVILDSGKCRYQIESTVISLVNDEIALIRPGAIPQKAISTLLGREIISLNKQLAVFDPIKSSLNNSKFKILCFDSIDEILEFAKANLGKRILIMTRNDSIFGQKNTIYTNVSTFFSELREAEKNEIDYLLVEKDEYVMSNEVLRHRLKIS
jgi:L-threonylcarbamoyladenylate synthase